MKTLNACEAVCLMMAVLTLSGSQTDNPQNADQQVCIPQKLSSGYVPDKEMAIAIAEALLTPIYGRSHIEAERPFHASLHKGVWSVSGTLHCKTAPCVGGVAFVQLSKEDGRILCTGHTR